MKIGLIGEIGREISGEGYERIDGSNIPFRVAELGDFPITFVNVMSVYWRPARAAWGKIRAIACYRDGAHEPFLCCELEAPVDLKARETFSLAPGKLRFGMRFNA
jgi:hypothetical protein